MANLQWKHFELIADALKRARPDKSERDAWNQWRADVLHVHNALATTNPNFNRGRFLAACGSPD